MRMPILAAALLALGHPAFAETPQVVVTPVFSTTTTASGQPIVLPQANAQVIVSTYDIAPGAKLPVHKHPSPRYAYVLSGTLRVTEQASGRTFDYQTGQFIVEVLNAWHFGEKSAPTRSASWSSTRSRRGTPTRSCRRSRQAWLDRSKRRVVDAAVFHHCSNVWRSVVAHGSNSAQSSAAPVIVRVVTLR